jgi:serine/threonine-protein kinase
VRTCPQCERTYPDDADFCLKDGTALPPVVDFTETVLASSLVRQYRIVKKLGAGGMGSVFLAEQITLGNRPVALKVLSRKLLDDPEFLLRFHIEGASTARIRHPNVVTIYNSGQADDGTPYIAMEFLEGESLRERLRRRGALPVGECAEILQQAARGLNAAHKLGIIHRDLNPNNLFLTRGDEGELIVKVVDFGIAKLRESTVHTMTGIVLGTPAYMSYEQASGMKSKDLDARSDIYSLGIVAYEMLTGRLPFVSDTQVGYLAKHLTDTPPSFRSVNPDMAELPQVESMVMKALTKDRDQRYGSVLEFAREIALATTRVSVPALQSQSQKTTERVQRGTTVADTAKTVAAARTRDMQKAARKQAPETPAAPPVPRLPKSASSIASPRIAGRASHGYKLPSATLLKGAANSEPIDENELKERATRLTAKFLDFGITGSVTQIHPGPVVTTYEFKPEDAIKYSRIANLADDLCLAMKAESILIDRIAGKSTVGIEVPNQYREIIHLRELLESNEFMGSDSRLSLGLGKEVSGKIRIEDLTQMLHLLIAGSAGSGKSVAINSMVVSILY